MVSQRLSEAMVCQNGVCVDEQPFMCGHGEYTVQKALGFGTQGVAFLLRREVDATPVSAGSGPTGLLEQVLALPEDERGHPCGLYRYRQRRVRSALVGPSIQLTNSERRIGRHRALLESRGRVRPPQDLQIRKQLRD